MFDKRGSIQYDTHLLNEMLLVQLLLTSIPQLVIKVYNNSLIDSGDVTVAYYLSVATSAIYIAFGLYRYLYLTITGKTSACRLSFLANFKVNNDSNADECELVVGIPSGTHDVRRNKEVRDLDYKRWTDKVCHNETEGVLDASEQLITRCYINEEQFMRTSTILGSNNDEMKTNLYKLHDELSNDLRARQFRPLSRHEIAEKVFQCILCDSKDRTTYDTLMAHNIRLPRDLIDISDNVAAKILSIISMNNAHKVKAYLKLITRTRATGIRDSATSLVESLGCWTSTDSSAVLYRLSSYNTDDDHSQQASISLSIRSVDTVLDNHHSSNKSTDSYRGISMVLEQAELKTDHDNNDAIGGTEADRLEQVGGTGKNNAESEDMEAGLTWINASSQKSINNPSSSEKSSGIWKNVASSKAK
jgi:hypothetical protein